MYLEQITFPDQETEFDFFLSIKRTVYDSYYPFQILPAFFSRSILSRSRFYMAAMVLAKPPH